jgi:hypothetical protein
LEQLVLAEGGEEKDSKLSKAKAKQEGYKKSSSILDKSKKNKHSPKEMHEPLLALS